MKLPRRRFLHLAAGATALPAVSRIARTQVYPSRQIRLLVGFPASGTTDTPTALTGVGVVQPYEALTRPLASSAAVDAGRSAPADQVRVDLLFLPAMLLKVDREGARA